MPIKLTANYAKRLGREGRCAMTAATETPPVLPLAEPRQPQPEKNEPTGILKYTSASRLNCFHECRLKFYFRYVERIPKPTAPALYVGQIVHRVLQRWNLNRWRGEPADTKTLLPVFLEHWQQGQKEDDPINWDDKEEVHRTMAWKILEHYLGNTPIPLDEKPEAVEVVVERDLMAAGLPPLKGVIDLVRANGRIVDFKTTARTPDPVQAVHQNEVQLGVLRPALPRGHRAPGGRA